MFGEILRRNGVLRVFHLVVKAGEVLYAKTVDIGVIGDVLLCEVCAQVSTVGADGEGKLLQGEVVLEIEQGVLAAFLQQGADLVGYIGSRLLILVCLQRLQRLHAPRMKQMMIRVFTWARNSEVMPTKNHTV